MIETGKITFQLGLLRRGLAGNLPEESESLIHIGKHARSFTHQMPYIPFILRRDLAQVGFARHRHFDPPKLSVSHVWRSNARPETWDVLEEVPPADPPSSRSVRNFRVTGENLF